MARLTINGKTIDVNADPNTPLLWAIREQAGLTGTKYGCGIAQCGACTVHLDGAATRSCILPVAAAEGKKITTIEGLATNGEFHPVQQAFHEHHGLQCGYCTAGMVMAAVSLLEEQPNPSETDVREGLEGNLCRCTGYHNIVKAVLAASGSGARGVPASTGSGS